MKEKKEKRYSFKVSKKKIDFDPYKLWDDEYYESLFSSMACDDIVGKIEKNIERERYLYDE